MNSEELIVGTSLMYIVGKQDVFVDTNRNLNEISICGCDCLQL